MSRRGSFQLIYSLQNIFKVLHVYLVLNEVTKVCLITCNTEKVQNFVSLCTERLHFRKFSCPLRRILTCESFLLIYDCHDNHLCKCHSVSHFFTLKPSEKENDLDIFGQFSIGLLRTDTNNANSRLSS